MWGQRLSSLFKPCVARGLAFSSAATAFVKGLLKSRKSKRPLKVESQTQRKSTLKSLGFGAGLRTFSEAQNQLRKYKPQPLNPQEVKRR